MDEKTKTEVAAGRNPVLELLRSQRELECVYLQKGLEKGPVGRIVALAKERGLSFSFGSCALRDVHPNSVLITLEGDRGGHLEVGASSPGGGRIRVFRVDGLDTSFSGELPTLVVHNSDTPGCVSQVTGALAAQGLNVATLQLNRGGRGGSAVMVIECDQPVSEATAQWLRSLPGILRVNRYTPDQEEPL